MTGDIIERRRILSEKAAAFRESAAILTANELGIFRILSEGEKSAEELALALNLDFRSLTALLNVLAGMEILAVEEGVYNFSELGREFLMEGSDLYLGDIFRHNFRLFKRWVRLEEVIRTGKPIVDPKARASQSDQDLRAFILGMENISKVSAVELADAIDLDGVKKILDLGGGPGTYLQTLLTRLPEAAGVLLDFPRVVEIAKEQSIKKRLQDRISYIPGDMLEDDYGKEYDLIIVSNIIHSHSESAVKQIFQKCADAVSSGGRVIVKDFYLDASGINPPGAALFTLNMMIGTAEGRSYKWNEITSWLANSGFSIVQQLKMASYSGVIAARKK